MKKTFSISKAISFSWDTFKNNWKFWIVVFFIYIAGIGGSGLGKNFPPKANDSDYLENTKVNTTTYKTDAFRNIERYGNSLTPLALVNLPFSRNPENVLGASSYQAQNSLLSPNTLDKQQPWVFTVLLILSLVIGTIFVAMTSLVSVIFSMGYISLTLDAVRSKQVYYKTLLSQVSFKKAVKLVLSQMLVGLIVAFGLFLFVIPGICFALKYSMVPYLIIDKDMDIGESLKESSKVTKGVRLEILLMYIVSGLLILLGVLVLGVGVIPASIVVSITQAYVYETLLKQSTEEDKVEIPVSTPPAPNNLLA
jgi:hypothetical protein